MLKLHERNFAANDGFEKEEEEEKVKQNFLAWSLKNWIFSVLNKQKKSKRKKRVEC